MRSPLRKTSRGQRLSFIALLSAGALIAPMAGTSSAADAQAVVPPTTFSTVDGPVTDALGASVVDLTEYGYVEHEYFATGEGNRYRQTGPLATAQVIDGGHDYKTRLLVRTPEDPRDFNGTVVVEWSNVTVGQDIDVTWAESHEYLLREGYAFVALSAQKVGVDKLTQWDPARYSQLSVDADNTDPLTGQPIDARADVLSWDIFSQVGKGLISPGAGVNPLAGLDVERLIGAGESQSAGRLTTYYNSIQPIHDVYDGLVYYDGAGSLRPDLTIPAISVNTEFSANGQNVTSPPLEGAYVRSWEVADTSHLSLEGMGYVDAQLVRDESLLGPDGQALSLTEAIPGCQYSPLWTAVDTGLVINAAFDHVDQWIAEGAPAPSSVRFERNPNGTLVRNASGNVLGGVQLPDVLAPTAENNAINTGPGFCRLTGTHRFLTAEELAERYRNHGAYVSQVKQALKPVVSAGYVLQEDAQEITRDAARSGIGR